MDAKQLLHQVLVGVASLEKVVQQELKEAEERFDQFVKLEELEALDKKYMERLRESMGDNVKRREKMARALDEMQRVVQEVVKVKSLLELSMEKVVEEEMKVTELDISLGVNRESLSAPGVILPLPLLDVGLHDHPLQVLDGAHGHGLLLDVNLII